MCIIFCEIVLCLWKFEEHVSQKKKKKKKIEEHEIEEKRMCFEKCFFGIQKKKNC